MEPFRERAGTRSGCDRDAQNSPQGRSWSAPGEPRAAGSRPKASLGQSREAPGPARSGVRACLEYRALPNMLTERLLVVFALARGSSDVCFVSVFTVFCWLRATSDTNACARRKGSKINAFRLQKSSPGASGRAKIGLERPGSSSKTRKVARFFWLWARTSQSVRQSERESASCWAGKNANLRVPRRLVKEPR